MCFANWEISKSYVKLEVKLSEMLLILLSITQAGPFEMVTISIMSSFVQYHTNKVDIKKWQGLQTIKLN